MRAAASSTTAWCLKVDEACVFIAPKIFGGEGKYSPVSGTGVDVPADAHMFGLDEVRRFDEDVMLRYKKV